MKDYRPVYHFTPPRNWMNDPNGPIYHRGEYHLFFQHNPFDTAWGSIHWGHAVSRDMLHWRHRPIALAPAKELGEDHCYSGCTVNAGGCHALFYTSIGPQRSAETGAEQWMAISHDGMNTWERIQENPILTLRDNAGLNIKDWRDPYVWKDGGRWLMVLGGSLDKIGCVCLYRSDNLKNWQFERLLHLADSAAICECPNFFPLENQYVLFYSPSATPQYHVGTFQDMGFRPERKGCIDYGGWSGFYAPTSFEDGQGRRILIGWVPEGKRPARSEGYDYAGALSLPREVRPGKEGLLRITPVQELQSLRDEGTNDSKHFKDVTLSQAKWDCGLRGQSVEIYAEIVFEKGCDEIILNVFESPNGEEVTPITVDVSQRMLFIDRTRSSLSGEVDRNIISGEVQYWEENRIVLHVFIDRSIAEVFLNEHTCISTRVYPWRDDSDGISLRLSGNGGAVVRVLNVFKLKSTLIKE